ncbi:response regulator [Granulosicoccaceae sp. 1_MG-2023]|nr:response regulator [Granulosicoccaceae sp. 1_MG-2023]
MDKKVLIVDDEPNILLSLAFLVQKAGFRTKTAEDGQAALDTVAQWQPDLVLLDVNMPVMDGFEVCQRLREDNSLGDLKIIILTAKGRNIEKEKGLALGADDYVTKPFSNADVVERIKHQLGAA